MHLQRGGRFDMSMHIYVLRDYHFDPPNEGALTIGTDFWKKTAVVA